jgi:DNA-binding NarL/FixJ family response regulator
MARRLLLVEDSSMMRRMISAMLPEEGYEVALAVDGREGLARAREFTPELILTEPPSPRSHRQRTWAIPCSPWGLCALFYTEVPLRRGFITR